MNAEIVTIGTELLLGQIVDTNAAYIAEHLNNTGVGVLYKTTVGDNALRMKEVLSRALERADIVITSGGLGPTEDDLTREIAAEVTGRKLLLHQELLEQIQRFFQERRISFKENNKRQAYIPEGAIPVENPQGTAPAYIIETGKGILISLPGVPSEMKYLMQQTVLPYLRQKLGTSQIIKYRVLKLCGIGESTVDHVISDLIASSSNPTIGLLAHLGQVDIRITAKAETSEQADRLIGTLEEKIRERLSDQILGYDEDTQESVLAQLLHKHTLSLAVAETNTGGSIGQRLVHIPEVHAVFRGGIVATDADSLHRLLHIPYEIISHEGMMSMETAIHIAQAVKKICEADIGLGITGERQSREGKILDTAIPVFIALSTPDGRIVTKEYHVSGSSAIIQTRVTNISLEMLRRVILGFENL